MNLKSILLSVLGVLLFLAGVLTGLRLSANVIWVESEALLYTSFHGDGNLHLKCPLMLSPVEAGVIRADIANITNENIKPQVSVEISHMGAPHRIDQTVDLIVGESKTLEWTVDPSDAVFDRLILVNILQSHYRDNPSYLGSCGILLFSLFGLSGGETFSLIFAASLIAMLSGGALWLSMQSRPLTHYAVNVSRISASLMVVTILALLTTLPRLWGITLILDAIIVLIIGIIFTDFVLFGQKYKN